MWHVRLVFSALSTGASLAWFRASIGTQERSRRKARGVGMVGTGHAQLDLLDPQLASLADSSRPITIGSLFSFFSVFIIFLYGAIEIKHAEIKEREKHSKPVSPDLP